MERPVWSRTAHPPSPIPSLLYPSNFWRHKNHEIVVEAIARLRRKNVRIPVVMTGLPADYRDPANQVLSQTLQAIACAGLGAKAGIVARQALLFEEFIALKLTRKKH